MASRDAIHLITTAATPTTTTISVDSMPDLRYFCLPLCIIKIFFIHRPHNSSPTTARRPSPAPLPASRPELYSLALRGAVGRVTSERSAELKMLLESSLRMNHQKQSRFFDGAHVRDALAAMPVEVADASTKSALWDLYVELSGRHELPLIKVSIN